MATYDDRHILPGGTTVTCENGHRICSTISPIQPGDTANSENLTAFERTEYIPQRGDTGEVCRCSRCGGLWVATLQNRDGQYVHALHTDRGWWAPRFSVAEY